jgi:broad specificity phosphatase PhoE
LVSPQKQAQDTAAALAETMGEDMPTRRDLSEAKSSLRTEMRELEGRLRSEIKESEHRMTIRLGAIIAASVALVAALVRLL